MTKKVKVDSNMNETKVEGSPVVQDNKTNDKELNFRALEAKYQKLLEQERIAKLEAEKKAEEVLSKISSKEEDDDDDDVDPYVDHKKFKREQAKFGQKIKQETQSEIQKAVQKAFAQERQQNWLKNNPDFYEVMNHAEKFAQNNPELAQTILEMPEGFERQKLVYKNIKTLGLHKPKETTPPIQEKVDANRRSAYYQPSGVGTAPYSPQGDFSDDGKKNAFKKMKELQQRLGV